MQGFDCDGEASACLDGRFLVRNLVHALIEDGQGRGPHTGDFVWRGDCLAVVGEMSGMTNVGTHRAPVSIPARSATSEACSKDASSDVWSEPRTSA